VFSQSSLFKPSSIFTASEVIDDPENSDSGLGSSVSLMVGVGVGLIAIAALLLLLFMYRRRQKAEEVAPVSEIECTVDTFSVNEEDDQSVYTNPLDDSAAPSEGLDDMVFSGSDQDEAI
jgi:hypothetical protein